MGQARSSHTLIRTEAADFDALQGTPLFRIAPLLFRIGAKEQLPGLLAGLCLACSIDNLRCFTILLVAVLQLFIMCYSIGKCGMFMAEVEHKVGMVP